MRYLQNIRSNEVSLQVDCLIPYGFSKESKLFEEIFAKARPSCGCFVVCLWNINNKEAAHGSTSLLEVILRLKVQKNKIDLLLHRWTCDFTLEKEKINKMWHFPRLIWEVDRRTWGVRWRHDPSVFKSMFKLPWFLIGPKFLLELR